MKKHALTLASHPLLMGVVGFVVGLVAAYSVPSLAEFTMMPEDGPPVGHERPMMEPRGDGRPPGPQGQEGPRDPKNLFGLPPQEGQMGGEHGAPMMDPSKFGMDQKNMREMGQDMSPEQQEAREKQDEARQQAEEARRGEQQKRMLEQMKRGMQQTSKVLASFKKMFDKWKAKNIVLPDVCLETYTEAKKLTDTVLNAESAEVLEDLSPEDMQDYMQTLQECRQTGERLVRLPQLLKRVDAEIKSLEKAWARAKKSAPEAAQDSVKEGDTVLTAIKEARVKVGDVIKSGEIDEIEVLIEDEIYGKLDDVRSHIQSLEAARNARKYMLEYVKQMRVARSYIERLRKLGKDVSELERILTAAQQKYEEIKALKPGSEAYQEAVEELAEIGSQFAEQTTSDQDVGAQLDSEQKK